MAKIIGIDKAEPSGNDGTAREIGNETSSINGIDAGSGNVNGVDAGSGNVNGVDAGSGNFQFVNSEQSTGKRGRGRPRKNPNAEAKTPSQKTAKKKLDDSEKVAKFLMQRLEKLSSMILAKDTSFNNEETLLIQPSLAAILEDMNFDAVEKYSKIINPLVLLFGLVMWYMRISPQPVSEKKQPKDDFSNGNENEVNHSDASNVAENGIYNPFISNTAH